MSISIEVIVNGKSVRKYNHNGHTYIEGRKGSEYSLQIRNSSSQRKLVVISVDGLSIMDGKPASSDSNGYVLGAWQTTEIPGWRLDSSEVAKFKFGHKKNSYAEKTGEGGNTGVIGVKVFDEYVYHRPVVRTFAPSPRWDRTYPWHGGWAGSCEDSVYATRGLAGGGGGGGSGGQGGSLGMGTGGYATAQASCFYASSEEPMFGNAISDSPLGTEFGKAETFQTTNTVFHKLSTFPSQEFAIYYETRRSLERRGITVVTEHQDQKWSNPFPGDGCKPPRNWKS